MFEKKVHLVLKLLSNVKTKRILLRFCGLLEKPQLYKPKICQLILKIDGLKDLG